MPVSLSISPFNFIIGKKASEEGHPGHFIPFFENLNFKLHRGEGSRGIFNTIETDFETTDYNSGLDNSFSNLHSRLIREELVVKRERIIQEISRLRALSAEIEDDEERYRLEVHISNLLREKRLLDRKISDLDHSSGGN